jgi:hypothetical protein
MKQIAQERSDELSQHHDHTPLGSAPNSGSDAGTQLLPWRRLSGRLFVSSTFRLLQLERPRHTSALPVVSARRIHYCNLKALATYTAIWSRVQIYSGW